MNSLRQLIREMIFDAKPQRNHIVGKQLKSAPRGWETRVKRTIEDDDSFYNGVPNKECEVIEISLWIIGTKPSEDYKVGWIALRDLGDHTYETHSELKFSYQGQGVGTLLYAKAFDYATKKGYKLVSSLEPSEKAQRTWKSANLNRLFNIVHKNGRFVFVGRK